MSASRSSPPWSSTASWRRAAIASSSEPPSWITSPVTRRRCAIYGCSSLPRSWPEWTRVTYPSASTKRSPSSSARSGLDLDATCAFTGSQASDDHPYRSASRDRSLQGGFPGRTVQVIPDPGPLLLGPERLEAVEQKLAAGLKVHHEDLEAAIGRPVRRPGRQRRIDVRGVAGPLANGRRVGAAKLGEMPFGSWKHDVAVVQLSEDLLEVPGAPSRDLAGPAEAELGRLQRVAQALGRDPHVVLLFDATGLERLRRERPQLVQPYPHDASGVLRQRPAGVELLHPAGLQPASATATASASTTSSDSRSLRAARRGGCT